MNVARWAMVVSVLVLGGSLLRAADTAPAGPVAGPKDENGLSAMLVVNKDTYTLDASQSGKNFRDKIDALRKTPGRPPAAPTVDLVLRLTNTTDKDLTISVGGDDSRINLKLEGPGAIAINPNVPMTMEFRIGKSLAIPAGKTADIKVTSLMNGMRGMTEYNYWTEPGDYTITASLTYPNAKGDKQIKVDSAPAKVTVKKGEG